MSTETEGFTDQGDPVASRLASALEAGGETGTADEPDGAWLTIAFMGHNEYTGYVTEIVKNGQPAYRVDRPEKLWGGNPLSYVEYAATAWFSDRPVTEEFVRKAWERHLREVAERKAREAEWQQREQRLELASGVRVTPDGFGLDGDDEEEGVRGGAYDVWGADFGVEGGKA